ncbi:50S ribosomal protein L21 [Roseisalinus antarcticus]|uniref:Large ribosomal subunit protein bL21 n=1 Tax=Roseisalinus antarcticus TaxID=254357 RepID=A0A1Y5TDA6_9RHOB|nr:50S ribosomal protein L21 [Roseisalinus antarcticus]SLN59393.1 50S ribosomal protein L21 [Roseisalinus antarcticus]
MFAVMKTGGKQYKVASGDILRVEKLAADAGETVQFNDILMIGGTVGAPLVEGAGVQAEVIDQVKGVKTINYVRRRRKHSSKRTKGHRQQLTLIRVTELLESGADASGVKAAVGAGSVSASAVAAAAPAPKAAKPAKKAAPAAEAQAADATGTKPGNLLTEAREGGADDLKKISGVGPKLEGLLNSNGVFHFDQIAAWGPEEIVYMDDLLSFKGRIERDNWIAQATEFAAEKE